MATTVQALTQVLDAGTESQHEDEELYRQLLRLQDVVLAGKHPIFKLPASAIERIKNAAIHQPALNGAVNGTAFTANNVQPQQSSLPSFPAPNGAFNFRASPVPLINGTKPTASTALDPIFLQKSDELVRAEAQIKRQRLDRDLQAHAEQRKQSSRDKDLAAEAPSPIDLDAVLLNAMERVRPISGLRKAGRRGSAASSSFDENDYYSSQVDSDWATEASSNKGSDKAGGAFTADFERLDGGSLRPTATGKRSIRRKEPMIPISPMPQSSKYRPHVYTNEPEGVYELGDEDDDYTPPDASAFDNVQNGGRDMQATTTQEDDNSDYEPGEITHDSDYPTAYHQAPLPAQPSPRVPVIRNRLTHLAAPQPNRVSPLATAKGQGFELELVNGRPEVVMQTSQPQRRANFDQSRASSASPSANGAGSSAKKRRAKKRKRDAEPPGRAKKKKQQLPMAQDHRETFIKNEPVSPPPTGAAFQQIPQYVQVSDRHAPVDLTSPRHAPQMQYGSEQPLRSGLRYEYGSPSASHAVTATTPTYRPVQRDTQDLRRVASLHNAQRPSSPQQIYSPVGPYRTISMTYGQQPMSQADTPRTTMHQQQPIQEAAHFIRNERSRSPPRVRESRETYTARAASPAMAPPPTAPVRRVVVDQYGNRYYAAPDQPEPAPVAALASTPFSRATAVPSGSYAPSEPVSDRGPSRMTATYSQPPHPAMQYDPGEARMAPPPTIRRQQHAPEPPIQYVDSNGYFVQQYIPRSAESTRYTQPPTSPVYQEVRNYEQMMPPPQPQFRLQPQPQPQPQPAAEPTSPVYMPRSYSVRPEAPQQTPQPTYMRSGTVAPVQYVRREAPQASVRAASVMPSTADYGAPQPQYREPTYAPAPQGVRYVDSDGNEVYPTQVRQVSEFRY